MFPGPPGDRCSRRAKERFLPQFPTGPATCAGSQLSCGSQLVSVALTGFVHSGIGPDALATNDGYRHFSLGSLHPKTDEKSWEGKDPNIDET